MTLSLPLDAEFAADQADRITALTQAVAAAGGNDCLLLHCTCERPHILKHADGFYGWLRQRETLRAVSVELVPGTTFPEGTPQMQTTYSGDDATEVPFSLEGLDSKGAQVAAPADTWTWNLDDPDASGASLATAPDSLSATVSPGTPTAGLVLHASGANTGLAASVAMTITAGPAVDVELVPGAPSAEPPPAEPTP